MNIWKVHRLMIASAAVFSGAFGVQLLRGADGEAVKVSIGLFSLVACGALIVYFRWFQQKTGKLQKKD